MSRAEWLLDVIADEFRGIKGFQVDYMPGWRTRGRDTFKPVGVINHHTGPGSYSALLHYMTYGSSIAPLCNVATSRPDNGIVRITIVTAGKANHAGRGYLPWTGKDNGNNTTVGFENMNDGRQTWPDQQIEGIARANAAVLKYLGRDVDRLADHKTYAPTRKVDRVHVDLEQWRHYVKTFMNERWYEMVVYGKRGTPDFGAACAGVDMAKRGVATSSLSEAQAAVQRGEKVIAVGGPAARDLNFEYVKGAVRVRGNQVAVVGNDGLDTLKLLEQALR